MSTEPRTESLRKSYLMYAGVLLFAIAIIAKIIVVQTQAQSSVFGILP